MILTIQIELPPGATYAEIKRQAEVAAQQLPYDVSSKPNGPECIKVKVPAHFDALSQPLIPAVQGEWRLDQSWR